MAVQSDVRRSEVVVKAKDGFSLTATRFDPPEGVVTRAAVVFGCATGVHAKLFNDFAA